MKYIDTVFEQEDLTKQPKSFRDIYFINRQSKVKYWAYSLLGLMVFAAFLPWTQNIKSRGKVTTLRQEQRQQGVYSAITGRVMKWYVKEGDLIKKGDTIAYLHEVKVEYLDPNLIDRTRQQINAKEIANENYLSKANTTNEQIRAMEEAQRLKVAQINNKISQTKAKIQADSMDMLAARNDFSIANEQLKRQKQLYEQGLVSLTQFEQRNQTFQNALAKRTGNEIKFMNSKQDLINLSLELNAVNQEYIEKISKSRGERYQSLSQVASGDADIAKLQNQYSSYKLRNELYYVIAPQTGQITRANKAGIGEIVKEGEELVQVVPDQTDMAIEIFVKPLDITLLQPGRKVNVIFDGFPAIVFSGWPTQSYGTFRGVITAISNNIDAASGNFRVLVKPDPNERPWPQVLRLGTATDTFILLKDVPLGYEVWRNINGFPPEYYQEPNSGKSGKKQVIN
ncbi:HlyD family secretion protein [Emticicia sp. BO119]|uniref:HlyD family secretion protein n=1 Tax=Emticicia sp. BO119 TaxID=2757768 RepID=UPI0015F005E4|nr:HlyD family efflux transporter periplasmic adaptor subunit [Emticicia sp. BO119]MBA4853406.1 HlyD family efflux transporter periplasmic adaptor subunit [Emticicia sp. BO119]